MEDITPKKVLIAVGCCVLLMVVMILVPVVLETWKI
jgi:hypothetical protein